MTTPVVRIGETAPKSLVVNVTPSDLLPDLTVVSAVVVDVQKPVNGRMAEVHWTGAMSNQALATLKVTHSFVTGDLDATGTYTVVVMMTTAGGVVRTDPVRFVVKGKYDV